jgi:hypothetical protein
MNFYHSPLTIHHKQESPMTKLKLLLTSRKFWAALIGLCLIILKAWKPDFPLQEEQLTAVVYVLVAYILGTGIEDGLSRTQVFKKIS